MKLFREILEWSEVWALLIPLIFIYRRKLMRLEYLRPVRYYVWTALVINIAISVIYNWKYWLNLPDWLFSNNFLYNIHSIARFCFFAWFFIALKQPFLQGLKKMVFALFILFVLINFIFFEDFFHYRFFSGRLFCVESCLLLLFSLQYYFFILTDTVQYDKRTPAFWVVTGLSIYVVICFPIFLFWQAMQDQFANFAIGIWDVHNLSYIVFCILLGKAFHTAWQKPGSGDGGVNSTKPKSQTLKHV